MSRIARKPLQIPAAVQVKQEDNLLMLQGPKGKLEYRVHEAIDVSLQEKEVKISLKSGFEEHYAMLGTTCVLLRNKVKGVEQGFERKLLLVGVGYRAKVQGKNLELSLGFSHPVSFPIPEGIAIETPSNTEIVIKGIDKEQVGQVAAEIRSIRSPDPYKGKGVRYSDEVVVTKEAKKK